MPSWGLLKYIETKLQSPSFYLYKAFLKNKKRSGISLPASFSAWFLKKLFLLLYSINWPNFVFWWSLLCEIFGNMCIVIGCYPGCNVINFEINPTFLIKLFFQSQDKNLNILRTKRAFKKKLKVLSIIFEGLSLKGLLRPIFCININTNGDRQSKNYVKFILKNYLFRMF